MATTPAELDEIVVQLSGRLAQRLVDERDHIVPAPATGASGMESGEDREPDEVVLRQQLLVGHWLTSEIAELSHRRLGSGRRPLDAADERQIRRRVVAELFGAGPLQEYLDDPDVEEIDVNSHEVTWVSYRDGRKIDVGRLWSSPQSLTAFQQRLARRMTSTGEGRLDTASPSLTLQGDDGSRIVMVLGGPHEHGISTHPRLAVRRFAVRRAGLGGLADLGLFPHGLLPLLRALVRTGFTMLISGPPGAGKTTLLVELLGEVPPSERIVTVEKHLLELRLEDDPRHPDAPALYTRAANAEGSGAVSTRDLVELTRRLNPDRVVIGELVEDEALDMLDIASMCARGSLATIHAHSADIVIARLAYYVAKSRTALAEYAVWSLIAQSVDFVLHLDLVRNTIDPRTAAGEERGDRRDQSGTRPQRRLETIIAVDGLGERGGVRSSDICRFDGQGRLDHLVPLPARHRRRLERAGYVLEELLAPLETAMPHNRQRFQTLAGSA